MSEKPTVVIFFNDWRVFPKGVNAGGGESATAALAKSIAQMGYRVIACANLPEGEVVHNGIEFWNFGNGYMVVDRLGLSVLRDPFSNNPYITFHATRRVGGGVVDFDAIKFLKFSA